jgi:hypothetical protein
MKTTVYLFLVFLGLVSPVAAQIQTPDKVTFYHMASQNTPSLPIREAMVADLSRSMTVDWKRGAGCAIKPQMQKDGRPLIVEFVSGRFWMSLQENNEDCTLDLDSLYFVSQISYPYEFCVKAGSDIRASDFLARSTTVGYNSGTGFAYFLKETQQHYQVDHKGILFKNSNDTLLGLLSGDVKIAILGILTSQPQKESGTIQCWATTRPGQNNSVDRLLPRVNRAYTTESSVWNLAIKNMNEQQKLEVIRSVQNTAKAITPLASRLIIGQDQVDEGHIRQSVKDSIFGMYEQTKKSR